jgi:hypothetical protein|tara:strand:+ start:8036 stop:9919 length:1884 start_codon:yes stop_codon:yes gene_type:complete
MAVDPNKYKVYAERDVDKSQVNWADAAKTITTDLKEIREDRANTRSQIETDTQKTLKELRTLDPVDNQQLGELALRGSDQSASYLMMQNDLLKSGEINPTDYMVGLQNQKDQWSNFSGAVKNWNAADLKARERLEAGDSSAAEWWINEQNEAFGNLENVSTFIDPQTGDMSVIELDENGQIPLLPNGEPDRSKYVNVNSMNVRINDQINKIDLNLDIAPDVDLMAGFIDSKWAPGAYGSRVEQIEDARNAPGYQKYLTGIVDKYTANPRQTLSILADNVGGYDYTRNPDEQGGNMILMEPDKRGLMQPVLTEEQENIAKEYIRTTIEGQVDAKETKTGSRSEASKALNKDEQIELARAKKDIQDDAPKMFDANNLRDAFSGTVKVGESVGGALVSMFNDTMSEDKSKIAPGGMQRTEDGFIFTLEDGTTADVNVFETIDGEKVQLADDIIAQKFATALGLSEKDIRQRFKDQGVKLGTFNTEAFAVQKSEGTLRAPRYNRGMVRGDDESPDAATFLKDKLTATIDGGFWGAKKTDGEITDAYQQLIDSYWDAGELGGVDLEVNDRVMTVTIDGEAQDPITIVGTDTPGEIWSKLKNIEAKARKAQDKKRSGGSPGTGDTSGTDTSQY